MEDGWGTERMTLGAPLGRRGQTPGCSLQWDIKEPWMAEPGFSQGSSWDLGGARNALSLRFWRLSCSHTPCISWDSHVPGCPKSPLTETDWGDKLEKTRPRLGPPMNGTVTFTAASRPPRTGGQTVSYSVNLFSSHLQSFPVSGSFPMSQFSASGGQSIGASASVLPVNTQD